MTAGRIVSTLISCTVVAGCAAVVVGMTRANTDPRSGERAVAGIASTTPRPAYLPRAAGTTTVRPASGPATTATTAATASTARPAATSSAAGSARPSGASSIAPSAAPSPVTAAATTPAIAAPAPRSAAPRVTVAPRPAARVTTASPARPRSQAPTTAPRVAPAAAPVGARLPLRYSTGSATRVVTVTAGSSRSTRASLQAWAKLSNGRWKKVGARIPAYVGSDGIGTASESRSKTPAGSFTVTQTFGRYANPGTKLRYVRTTPSDYWISSPGSKYNTRQRCGSCGYNNGVNERLYYTTPFYNYAAVIDYNTRNAPGGVRQGRGSAFFLHVSTGSATAGCVAIPQTRLVSLLRWLTPTAHPRILIGVT